MLQQNRSFCAHMSMRYANNTSAKYRWSVCLHVYTQLHKFAHDSLLLTLLTNKYPYVIYRTHSRQMKSANESHKMLSVI